MEDSYYTAAVREDFDRIADLSEAQGWNHNVHYHAFLLGQLPPRPGDALEIGCGTGTFARSLAKRCERVLAGDLSPRMVEVARDRSKGYPNVEYAVADVNSWEFSEGGFDCVASIATVHHLPLAPLLGKMGGALRPGGVLLVLDLYRASGYADLLMGAAGLPANKAIRLAMTGALSEPPQPPEVERAWNEHFATDIFSTLEEVRSACEAAELKGARVRRHMLWRYSMVWRKPLR